MTNSRRSKLLFGADSIALLASACTSVLTADVGNASTIGMVLPQTGSNRSRNSTPSTASNLTTTRCMQPTTWRMDRSPDPTRSRQRSSPNARRPSLRTLERHMPNLVSTTVPCSPHLNHGPREIGKSSASFGTSSSSSSPDRWRILRSDPAAVWVCPTVTPTVR